MTSETEVRDVCFKSKHDGEERAPQVRRALTGPRGLRPPRTHRVVVGFRMVVAMSSEKGVGA